MELLNSVMQKLEPISDILYTGCRKPEVEIPPIPFPVNEVFENAVPIPFVDTFIYFINGMLIEGQFYGEEFTPVRVTKLSVYKIEKVFDKRYRNGILEYLVHWEGYRRYFESSVPAARVKII